MNVLQKMISTQALLFLYMLTGIFVFRAKIITQENRKVLVRLLMDVCVPLMVLDAFNHAYTMEELKASVTIMVLSAIGCVLGGIAGHFIFRKEPDGRKQILQYTMMFSNAGIAGLPVSLLVFGEIGVFYTSMYLIPPRIMQWTYGISMFTGKMSDRRAFVKNVLLNPIVVVVYIGMFMLFSGWTIPGVFASAIDGIGGMTAPMSMMLMGATLASMDLKMLLDRSVMKITALRLLAIPIVGALVMKCTTVDLLISSVFVTLLAMPAPTNVATISERYDGDYRFASAIVCISTLLSVVTIPLITFFIQNL